MRKSQLCPLCPESCVSNYDVYLFGSYLVSLNCTSAMLSGAFNEFFATGSSKKYVLPEAAGYSRSELSEKGHFGSREREKRLKAQEKNMRHVLVGWHLRLLISMPTKGVISLFKFQLSYQKLMFITSLAQTVNKDISLAQLLYIKNDFLVFDLEIAFKW